MGYMKLTGRTILITGGSAGIGLGFALKFLELGNTVIVTGRRQSVLDEVKAKYPNLHTIQGDVADTAQIKALAAPLPFNDNSEAEPRTEPGLRHFANRPSINSFLTTESPDFKACSTVC